MRRIIKQLIILIISIVSILTLQFSTLTVYAASDDTVVDTYDEGYFRILFLLY